MSIEIDLVLGSGGVRCISYAGAIEELYRQGYRARSISTCSGGTFFGAMLAAGMSPEQIVEKAVSISPRKMMGRRIWLGRLFRPYAKYSASRVSQLFQQAVGKELRFSDLQIRLSTIAVDLTASKLLLYDRESHAEMSVGEAISIATAVPFMVPPHVRKQRIIVDGALVSSLPIWVPAGRQNQRPIVALSCPNTSLDLEEDSLRTYLNTVIGAGVAARDRYTLSNTPTARHIPISTPGISAYDFRISAKVRQKLVQTGRDAVAVALQGAPIEWNGTESLSPNRQELDENDQRSSQVGTEAGESERDDEQAEQVAFQTINYYYGSVHTGHKIVNHGQGIINVESTLSGVAMSIGGSANLQSDEREKFQSALSELTEQIKELEKKSSDEAALLSSRLQEVVKQVDKPAEERSSSLLNLSCDGLLDAAKAVGESVPLLIPAAKSIAQLALGLL